MAKNPASPIEKGLPGPGLLAHIAVSKYADHLPLNRMEGILSRHGVAISRSTMADWMAEGAHLVTTLVGEMKRHVLLSDVIHTDDTPVTVQDPKGKSKPHTGISAQTTAAILRLPCTALSSPPSGMDLTRGDTCGTSLRGSRA